VKQIEAEEKKRKEVKELTVQPPSHRSDSTNSVHTDQTVQIIYRASHIILDYLQDVTPNTRKTWYFLQENFLK